MIRNRMCVNLNECPRPPGDINICVYMSVMKDSNADSELLFILKTT